MEKTCERDQRAEVKISHLKERKERKWCQIVGELECGWKTKKTKVIKRTQSSTDRWRRLILRSGGSCWRFEPRRV